MHKLPVFATVGNALAFAFGNFFTVLRLAWLPFALYVLAMGVIVYATQNVIFAEMMTSTPSDPRALFRHWDDLAFVYATMLILQAIAFSAVAVSIHKVILFGDRKPGDYFVFAFGRTEFVYVVMVTLSFLGVLAVMAAILTPVVYVISNGDFAAFFDRFEDWPRNMPSLVQSGDFGLIMGGYILGWIVLIYFFLRLAVWPPAVVATGRLALGEAWSLTRGNVLRIFGMFMLLVVTIWILMIPLGILLAFVTVPYAMHHARDMSEVPGPAAMHDAMREIFTPMLPVFVLIEVVIYVFMTGLTVAILSYAYKALKGVDAKEPLPQD